MAMLSHKNSCPGCQEIYIFDSPSLAIIPIYTTGTYKFVRPIPGSREYFEILTT